MGKIRPQLGGARVGQSNKVYLTIYSVMNQQTLSVTSQTHSQVENWGKKSCDGYSRSLKVSDCREEFLRHLLR